jgi:glycosyltransferase involved in cell wall biosynthesis
MNILNVIHYPFFGGPHNQTLRTAAQLEQRDIKTLVVLPDDPGNAELRLRDAGIDVTIMPMHRLRVTLNPVRQARFVAHFPSEVQALRRLIRERRIDVVQVTGLVNPHGAVAARLEGVGLVWQILDTRAPAWLRWLMMPWVLVLADIVMTTGMGVARVHPGAINLGKRLVPFYPPVDTSIFRPDPRRRRAARDELGVSSASSLIGTVANITPQKGLEHFIAVADRIHARRPEDRFVILGSAMATQRAYEATVRELARRGSAGKAGAIQIVDPGDRVWELLPALDIFLLTSVPQSEGVSTTVLEAMATGIPVVSTDVGALSEVVLDGVTGRIVPLLDDAAMSTATVELLEDPALRTRMGKQARQFTTNSFDVSRSAESHVHAYELAAARAYRRRNRGYRRHER